MWPVQRMKKESSAGRISTLLSEWLTIIDQVREDFSSTKKSVRITQLKLHIYTHLWRKRAATESQLNEET